MRSIARITALFASNFYFLSPIITFFFSIVESIKNMLCTNLHDYNS